MGLFGFGAPIPGPMEAGQNAVPGRGANASFGHPFR